DGQVTAVDFNLWSASTAAGETGYLFPDFNFDGQVTAVDFNLWSASTAAGAETSVPLTGGLPPAFQSASPARAADSAGVVGPSGVSPPPSRTTRSRSDVAPRQLP
ncbi:MAG: hypothetical protein R3362_05405, partial [Rhodothermales bacterium]|nr:hypothetical protein [Rhodothermales bacterium]